MLMLGMHFWRIRIHPIQPLYRANVLLLGDSIAATGTGYYDNVYNKLEANVATVSNPRMYPQGGGYCGTSFGVVACLVSTA